MPRRLVTSLLSHASHPPGFALPHRRRRHHGRRGRGQPASYAQSPAEVNLAKQTAGDGLTAYNAGEFDKALGLFNQAKKIYPSGQILRMIGYSELALEHWGKALDALEVALNAKITPLSKDDRKDVQDQNRQGDGPHRDDQRVVQGARRPARRRRRRAARAPARQAAAPRRGPAQAGGDGARSPRRHERSQGRGWQDARPRARSAAEARGASASTASASAPPPPPERGELVPHQRAVGIGVLGGGAAFGAAALVTIIEAAHYRSIANSDVEQHLAIYGSGCAMGNFRLCSYDISVTNSEGEPRRPSPQRGRRARRHGGRAGGGRRGPRRRSRPRRRRRRPTARCPARRRACAAASAAGPGFLCTGAF